jgi:hypothetical protein
MREAFIAENPAGLPAADLALTASWRDRVAGQFFILRHLKKYSVFLAQERPPKAYGVLGLASSIQEIIPSQALPVLVEAVLLPFEGKIIYDSLLAPYSVTFGSGIRRNLNDDYRHVQERGGVVTFAGAAQRRRCPAGHPHQQSKSAGSLPQRPRRFWLKLEDDRATRQYDCDFHRRLFIGVRSASIAVRP